MADQGMGDLMDSMYESNPGARQAAAERVSNNPSSPSVAAGDRKDSMNNLMEFVETEHYGRSPAQPPSGARTRAVITERQSTGDSSEQLMAVFDQFVRDIGSSVSSLTESDGDEAWELIIDHVDRVWSNFTENGHTP